MQKFYAGQLVKITKQDAVYYNHIKEAIYDVTWDLWEYTLYETHQGVRYREDWLEPATHDEFVGLFDLMTPHPFGGWVLLLKEAQCHATDKQDA